MITTQNATDPGVYALHFSHNTLYIGASRNVPYRLRTTMYYLHIGKYHNKFVQQLYDNGHFLHHSRLVLLQPVDVSRIFEEEARYINLYWDRLVNIVIPDYPAT